MERTGWTFVGWRAGWPLLLWFCGGTRLDCAERTGWTFVGWRDGPRCCVVVRGEDWIVRVCNLLYIQEWDHSRHVDYLFSLCACQDIDALVDSSDFKLCLLVGYPQNMSLVDAWIEQLPAFTNKDFQTVHQAVMKEAERREDCKIFSRFRRRTLPADIRDELSSEDSPGEFSGHVQRFVEHMVQDFEMQTTRLRIEQLQAAFQLMKKQRKRPTFTRSLQFSSEATSIDQVVMQGAGGSQTGLRPTKTPVL